MIDFDRERDLDERQKVIYKKFSADSLLGTQKGADNFILWVTFFRRNLHRFAIDYLGISLHTYQIIWLYLMGINRFFVVVASRASAKSWMIALYACCKCILYPNTIVVIASSTKNQSKLMISDKIQRELAGRYPAINREISRVAISQNEMAVYWKNNSVIRVVACNDNARGNRSNILIREEFRQIKKEIEDSVLSPFQIGRMPPYLTDSYYSNIEELKEDSVDIYISSSWFDNDSDNSWMWKIVDSAWKEMLNDKPYFALAFDESVALKHGLRKQEIYQSEKKKQDPITWRLEYMNERLKENMSAFFNYSLLQQNQVCKQPFYPRTVLDYRSGKKNPYAIPKLRGEVRIIGCDLAFIENEKNDNTVFTCARLLPENTSHTSDEGKEITYDNGYRMVVCYMESMQGGETKKQAIRIRQLFEDFQADYIVMDIKNAGISIYDALARALYDEERGVEYFPFTCMNDETVANRIKIEGAEPRIYGMNATQKINSDIAINFRKRLAEKKVDFLVSFETAKEEILHQIKEYISAEDPDTMLMYERPFLETQALFAETSELMYERKPDGLIIVHEVGNKRKDRYTSCSYTAYLCSLLERDLLANNGDYEVSVFIN